METKRQRQVGELVKRNFSIVLQEEGVYIFGAEPLVTVTEVKMTPDLGLAKIYLSIWNTENKQAVLMLLAEEQTRLRQGLGHRLRRQVRRIPAIDFYLDETLDEMFKVDALFDRLHEEKQMGKDEPTEE
ncbi:MAG: 30S ribosome-binding factor RbfA [Bacteroidetes bacterium]|nr:MAG: 30S ribosome-binding factor RbfA [Bacteroidota bacterium]PTM09376.1 MAG: 30S ribosome-binding factor RbfA [Bacteroidota bacterium]